MVVRYLLGKKRTKLGAWSLVYEDPGHVPLEAPRGVRLGRAHKLYRARFGIESSFRISGQAWPRNCARKVPWRMRSLGVALMQENGWAVLRLPYLLGQEFTGEGSCVGVGLFGELDRLQGCLGHCRHPDRRVPPRVRHSAS